MSRFWCCLLPMLASSAAVLSSCGTGSCGGAGGSSDVCPPPAYGYAQVNGRAVRDDGTPIARQQVYVACGDVVGAYDDATDAQGQFRVWPVYAVFDTLLYPFPPRAADGSFELSCRASMRLAHDLILVTDPLAVRFAPTRAAIVPTTTELRGGSQ